MPDTSFYCCNFAETDLSDIDGWTNAIRFYHCNTYHLFTLNEVPNYYDACVEVNITNQTEWLNFVKANKVWKIKK